MLEDAKARLDAIRSTLSDVNVDARVPMGGASWRSGVFVYLGTTPIGSIITGRIISAGGPRTALLVGSGACLAAAVLAALVHTPTHPDDALTDLGQ